MTQQLFEAPLSRRSALTLTAPIILSACAQGSRSPFFSTLANFRRSASPAVDPEKIAALPYASMQAWFNGNSKALLVLGEYQANERLVWYSADRQSVTTWGPFVLRLLGLDVSVRDTTLSSGWSRDLRNLVGRKLEKSVNLQTKSQLVTMQTRSSFRLGVIEDVGLLTGRRPLRRIEEHVLADGAHAFENLYWIDENTGFCWKSRQLVIPTMTPFNIQITKAPQKT